MMSRNLRLFLASMAYALGVVALLSCSATKQTIPDPISPGGPGGGAGLAPGIDAISPDETCSTAGNLVTIFGENLVGTGFLSNVFINGVRANVVGRVDGAFTDQLVVE